MGQLSTSDALGIAAVCFLGMVASLIVCAWREALHRSDLLALREYIEDLSHNSIMDYAQIMRAALEYITKTLGE